MISVPTLNLRSHRNGAEARLVCSGMSAWDRLVVLQVALAALLTGRFQFSIPHVRTVHQGCQVRLAYLPASDDSRH